MFSKPVLIIIPARIEIPSSPIGDRDIYGTSIKQVRESLMLSPWDRGNTLELNELLKKLWHMTPEKK